MKSLVEIITDSIAITAIDAHTYVNLKNDITNNRTMLLASLNEAKGKPIMGFQLLCEMGKADEASHVLDYFIKETIPDFQEMLKVNE